LIDLTVLEDKFLLLSQLDITLSYHTTLACTSYGYIGDIINLNLMDVDGDADFPNKSGVPFMKLPRNFTSVPSDDSG
jgi:hypothetical protein